MTQLDDLIWAYCSGCEKRIPADEYNEFDGFCETCWDKIQDERENSL